MARWRGSLQRSETRAGHDGAHARTRHGTHGTEPLRTFCSIRPSSRVWAEVSKVWAYVSVCLCDISIPKPRQCMENFRRTSSSRHRSSWSLHAWPDGLSFTPRRRRHATIERLGAASVILQPSTYVVPSAFPRGGGGLMRSSQENTNVCESGEG